MRRADWRVLNVSVHADCAAVHLAGIGAANLGCRRVVLHPFDRAAPLAHARRPRLVDAGAWSLAASALAARRVVYGSIGAALDARIDLLPYQFEPALALVRGLATRVLLADAVGLGKTVQACLALAALRAREPSARALIITPAGLREQWARELGARFAISAAIVDAASLRRAAASLPAGVNPWDTDPVVITSCDFVKQPEVNRALEATVWDLVIVDEAHMAATARERQQAVDALGCRARWLVLLTATPHAGDDEGFRSLCRLGELAGDRPMMMFRRTAVDAGVGRDRRVHLLRILQTPAEEALHARLGRYSRLVWEATGAGHGSDARLAMIVLHKRAFSGVAALAQSLRHRLAGLGGEGVPAAVQLLLPLALDPDGETDADDVVPAAVLFSPGLADLELECRLLAELLDLAAAAGAHDSKSAALIRLLRRARQPAIVFTEYRDTALALADMLAPVVPIAVLHGGLDRHARREAERRFLGGEAGVLLATDAAGQGLNLQSRCRLVVNLELPWNPMRLEQRIGRVDRIGQSRRVHAINLLAANTAEESILGHLVRRIARVRETVGHDVDPLGISARIAAAMLDPDPERARAAVAIPGVARSGPWPAVEANAAATPPSDLADAARVECGSLGHAREALTPPSRSRGRRRNDVPAALEATGPWAAIVSGIRGLAPNGIGGLAPGVLGVYRVPLIDWRGRLVEEVIVPVHAEMDVAAFRADGRGTHANALFGVAEAVLPVLCDRARGAALARLAAVARDAASSGRAAREREAAIAALLRRSLEPGATSPFQARLFDRRALRQAAARRLQWAGLRRALDERRAACEKAEKLSLSRDPELVLLLWIAPGR